MKKFILFIVSAFAIAVFTGCSNENEIKTLNILMKQLVMEEMLKLAIYYQSILKVG